MKASYRDERKGRIGEKLGWKNWLGWEADGEWVWRKGEESRMQLW